MRTFATDFNNDLYVVGDDLAMYEGIEAVMQLCEHSVKAQLGEMILAMEDGVPTMQTVWQSAANIAMFEAYLRRAIMSVPNVTGIASLAISVEGSAVVYSATIQTIYGIGNINNGL